MSGQLDIDRWLAERAERQHAVVAWWQMRAAGVARDAVDRRLARGRLHIVRRGVYAVGHRLLTDKGRWMAGVLCLGPDAVLSHRSAAVLYGILRGGARIHATVPQAGGLATRPGMRIHRVPGVERSAWDGIPVTPVAWTLRDLAATAAPRVVEQAVEGAERLRLFDLEDVRRLTGSGRAGSRVLREVVAEYDDAPTRLELERRFLRLCADHGVPRPLVNTLVAGFEVDFHWPEHRVVVECDSLRFHGTWQSAERDRERDAALALAGHRTQRFTWKQIARDARTVVAVLWTLLRG